MKTNNYALPAKQFVSIAIGCALLLPAAAQVGTSPAKPLSLPFQYEGYIVLNAKINNTHPVKLLLDTGADELLLDEQYFNGTVILTSPTALNHDLASKIFKKMKFFSAIPGMSTINKSSTLGAWVVTGLFEGGNAEKAGLRVGDRIVSIGGKKITEMGEEERVGLFRKPGSPVEVAFMRDGAERKVVLERVERL